MENKTEANIREQATCAEPEVVTTNGMTRKVDGGTYEAFGSTVASIRTNHAFTVFNLRCFRGKRLCSFNGSAVLDSF